MRFAVYRVTAPAAVVRAAARRDQGNGPRAVMLAPHREISVQIDTFAVRPRLGIQVLDLRRRRILDQTAIRRLKGDSGYRSQSGSGRKQALQNQFTFALDDRIRART